MESLPGCSSAVVTERLSTVTWGTRQPSLRVSAIQSVGVTAQSNAQLQGLYTIRTELQNIEAKECLYRELKEEVLLGEGETFTVNRCVLEGQLVAVKHLKLGSWAANTPKFAARLNAVLMELRIMCFTHVRGHPNILSLLGYGWRHEQEAILPYIVVDYSSHGTLRDFLKNEFELDIYRKKRLIQDVASGLDALHSSGIIHGDLKLDNVLVSDRSGDPKAGRIAKICDFGHSLLLSAEEDELLYRGTSVYNAPEVHKQAVVPIPKCMLARCDIWAYGLLVLEVLVNGDLYRDHLGDEIYFDPTMIYDNPQIYCRELLKTALRQAEGLQDKFVKIFFKGLFRRTLMLKPTARTIHLSATMPHAHPPLQLPRRWNWSFEIFHPEQAKTYSWEQQRQIFQNFELSYQKIKRDTQASAPAAFQLGICYLEGFGVQADKDLAQQYLGSAEQSRHFVAQLINPLIQDSTGQYHHQKLYTAAVIRGLASKNVNRFSSPVSLIFNNDTLTIPRYSSLREQILALESRAWAGVISQTESKSPPPSSSSSSSTTSIRIRSRKDLIELKIQLQDFNATSVNLMEYAIMLRDLTMIEMLGRLYDLGQHPSTLPVSETRRNGRAETLLIQACRTGDVRIVETVVRMGERYKDVMSDGCTLLHWLFMLGADTIPFAKKHLSNIPMRDIIDSPCTRARDLDKQWPFQLVGTPLAFSIWSGSLDAVKALLQLGANPAAPAFGESESLIDGIIWTHLHLAAMLHHAEIFILLIAALDPNEKLSLSTSSIASVLSYSSNVERIAIHGRFTKTALQRTVAALEAIDQNPNWSEDSITDCKKFRPLAIAIEFNDRAVVRALLQRYPHLASLPIYDHNDPSCYTRAAHLAVRIGSRLEATDSVSILKILHDHKSDSLTTLDSSGNTPLHIAVTEYSILLSQWLLDHHPDPPSLLQAIDQNGRTALHYCVNPETTELLLQREISVNHADNFGMTSLHCASLTGASDVMIVLLQWHADINAVDITSSSALHYAVASGSSGAAQLLISREANIHLQNIHGESPLHIAVRRQRDDLVRELLQRGACTALQNIHGQTPLHNALLLSTSDPRKLVGLCSQEAVQICDQDGNNVFHHCVLRKRLDWLKAIMALHREHDLSVLNASGQTPLHIAARNIDSQITQQLLDGQADVNSKDASGDTAVHIVLAKAGTSEAERERFCRMLAARGADFTIANHKGQTPWSIVENYQSERLMTLILELGGIQACQHIAFHDALLQAAFGEKSLAQTVAYYRNLWLYHIPDVSRYLALQIQVQENIDDSTVLSLSFQDYDKEVYVGEDVGSSQDHDEQTAAERAASPAEQNLPEVIDRIPDAFSKDHPNIIRINETLPEVYHGSGPYEMEAMPRPYPYTEVLPQTVKMHDALKRSLKIIGVATGGTLLAVTLLPAAPVLIPLCKLYRDRIIVTGPLGLCARTTLLANLFIVLWRRRKASRRYDKDIYAELPGCLPNGVPGYNIYELWSRPPVELPCDPIADKTAVVKSDLGVEQSAIVSIYIVEADLLQFLVDEGISRLLSFAEQQQEEEMIRDRVVEEVEYESSTAESTDPSSAGSTDRGTEPHSGHDSLYSMSDYASGNESGNDGARGQLIFSERMPTAESALPKCCCAECMDEQLEETAPIDPKLQPSIPEDVMSISASELIIQREKRLRYQLVPKLQPVRFGRELKSLDS